MSIGDPLPAGRQATPRDGVLTALLRVVDDAVILIDLDGHVLEWSGGAERLYGWTARETRGRRFYDFIAPAEAQGLFEDVRATVLAQETIRRRAHRRTKGGGTVVTDASITVVRSADGTPVAFLAVARDVSADEARRAEHRRLAEAHQDLLAQVQALGALVPVCAGCRRVQGDDGTWRRPGDGRTGVTVRRLCPECAAQETRPRE